MSLPFFYAETNAAPGAEVELDEDNSKHIVQVLRMQPGEKLLLTNGQGTALQAVITTAHKKVCRVQVLTSQFTARPRPELTIGISLVKNASRFEWFLEKATELGTAAIIPLLCERTERQHIRQDRLLNICKSAMLQSSQSWLPQLDEPHTFADVVETARHHQKFIAHCSGGQPHDLLTVFNPTLPSQLVLIGPEGDFTDGEVEKAKSLNFESVSLGKTRLRTETAGVFAAVVCRTHD